VGALIGGTKPLEENKEKVTVRDDYRRTPSLCHMRELNTSVLGINLWSGCMGLKKGPTHRDVREMW
jgi:hypothetical protein